MNACHIMPLAVAFISVLSCVTSLYSCGHGSEIPFISMFVACHSSHHAGRIRLGGSRPSHERKRRGRSLRTREALCARTWCLDVCWICCQARRERERERERQVQDPPVGVSWLNYPTRIRPFGFQTGHPEGRRVLGVSFSFGGVPMVSGARNRWKTTRCCARFLFRSPGKGKGKGKEPKGKGKGEGCPGGMGSGMIGLSGEVSAIQTQGLDPQVVGFNVGG